MLVTLVPTLTLFNGKESHGVVSEVTPSLPQVVFGHYPLSQQQNSLPIHCRTLGHRNLARQVLHSDACSLSHSDFLILLLSHFRKKKSNNTVTSSSDCLVFPLVKTDEFTLQSLSGRFITLLMAFIFFNSFSMC